MKDASAYTWAKSAREAEEAIDLSRFPLGLAVRFQPHPFHVEIQVKMVVIDRDAPAGSTQRMAVGTAELVSHDQIEQIAEYIARDNIVEWRVARKQALIERALLFVRSIILHELDECTLVDGKRIYDPHTERRRFDAHP